MSDFVLQNVVHFDLQTGEIKQWSQTNIVFEIAGFGVAEVLFVGDDPAPVPNLTPRDFRATHKVDLASIDHSSGHPVCRMVPLSAAELAAREPALADVKAVLKGEVDAAAERERLKYITFGAGQELVYEAKSAEVARWRAAGSPLIVDAAAFPWAADRATRRNVAVHDVLVEWAERADAFVAIGIAIENARETAKEAITAAEDAAAARAAAAAVVWPQAPLS